MKAIFQHLITTSKEVIKTLTSMLMELMEKIQINENISNFENSLIDNSSCW